MVFYFRMATGMIGFVLTRGRAYRCVPCGYVENKSRAELQFYTKHVMDHEIPFACDPCDFKMGDKKKLRLLSKLTVHGSWFTVHGSRFAVHGSRFTVHDSRFTVHDSRFTIRSSRFTIRSSRFTIRSSLFTVLDSQFTVHDSQ